MNKVNWADALKKFVAKNPPRPQQVLFLPKDIDDETDKLFLDMIEKEKDF
jgi:hypothetical protein